VLFPFVIVVTTVIRQGASRPSRQLLERHVGNSGCFDVDQGETFLRRQQLALGLHNCVNDPVARSFSLATGRGVVNANELAIALQYFARDNNRVDVSWARVEYH
jgi:hypothetical protein